MKALVLSFLAMLLALVAADPPQQITFPRCGMNTVISSIASSGCGVTELGCLCKAQSFIKMANHGIAKACKDPDELKVYVGFINAQCLNQPGYPVNTKALSSAASRNLIVNNGVWSIWGAGLLAVFGL